MHPRVRLVARAIVLAALLQHFPSTTNAQTGANVAVVINEGSDASVKIGEYYASKRGVPSTHIIRIAAPLKESISRSDYVRTIETPVGAALSKHALQDQVLYLVLTKGVPLKIEGTFGANGTGASVDSELTLLYRRLTGRPAPPAGTIPNPYYLGEAPVAKAVRFSHREHDIYLVTRLDGFSVDDVIALIDRGLASQSEGAIALDARMEKASVIGDRWMTEAAAVIEAAADGRKVLLDETRQPVTASDSLLGYYSWGSLDAAWTGRAPQLRFAPGALAAMLTSTDARTFEAPPEGWQPSVTAADRRGVFAGSQQALLGDLVRAGVTGAAGNVSEPLLQSAVRPQVLFPAYLTGFNLAESFYLALPHLSWQGVVLGDPLVQPITRAELQLTDPAPAIDQGTGLPAHFGGRRLANLKASINALPDDAGRQVLASESARARGDRPAAKTSLLRAVSAAPDQQQLRLDLALLHEEDGETAEANRLYREILEARPRNVVALNNLAFALATKEKNLAEALELARRAHALVPQEPTVMDTLGWIEHLSGNTREGVKLLEAAARLAPENADIRLHTALALGAIGAYQEAAKHLEAAIALDGALDSREDVKALKRRMSGR